VCIPKLMEVVRYVSRRSSFQSICVIEQTLFVGDPPSSRSDFPVVVVVAVVGAIVVVAVIIVVVVVVFLCRSRRRRLVQIEKVKLFSV